MIAPTPDSNLAEHPGRSCSAWEEGIQFGNGEFSRGCLCFPESSRLGALQAAVHILERLQQIHFTSFVPQFPLFRRESGSHVEL